MSVRAFKSEHGAYLAAQNGWISKKLVIVQAFNADECKFTVTETGEQKYKSPLVTIQAHFGGYLATKWTKKGENPTIYFSDTITPECMWIVGDNTVKNYVGDGTNYLSGAENGSVELVDTSNTREFSSDYNWTVEEH